MKSLAICIPTYNRCEVVKDTFSYELDTCRDLGIDIYLYDSSSDGETKKYVETLCGYENVHHIEIASSVTLDEKVVMIYQSYNRPKKHDYIWLVGDSVGFGKEILHRVMNSLQTEPTLLFINNEDFQHLGDKEYSDVSTIFQELFWKSTLWGSIIIKEALYYDVDWKIYVEKFVGTDQISVGLHWYRLAQIKDGFKGILFSVQKGTDMRKSTLKKFAWWKESECGSETGYRVWAKGLLDTVDQLPFTDAEKEAAIETQRLYMKTYSWLNLCRSRKDGVYNKAIYMKYREGIKRLSKYPYFVLYLIAITPKLLMKVIVRLADKFQK